LTLDLPGIRRRPGRDSDEVIRFGRAEAAVRIVGVAVARDDRVREMVQAIADRAFAITTTATRGRASVRGRSVTGNRAAAQSDPARTVARGSENATSTGRGVVEEGA
jgi:hypothetical protein